MVVGIGIMVVRLYSLIRKKNRGGGGEDGHGRGDEGSDRRGGEGESGNGGDHTQTQLRNSRDHRRVARRRRRMGRRRHGVM